uniref:Uncharacterized protein n=1 Tax=Rhizophora mucronata TaxID=61149 RepID=A0A2P2NTW5_RHIMU
MPCFRLLGAYDFEAILRFIFPFQVFHSYSDHMFI